MDKKLITHAFKMVNVKRFAGLHLNSPYSVGEHTHRVATLAMEITNWYNVENPENKISLEEVLVKALLHDMEESISNDMPSYVKRHGNLRDELRKAGEWLMEEKILKGSSMPEHYFKMWKEDKDGESGEVIELADKIEGLLVCYFEVKRNNLSLTKPLINQIDWFKTDLAVKLLNKYSFANYIYQGVIDYLTDFDKKQENLKKTIKEAAKDSKK